MPFPPKKKSAKKPAVTVKPTQKNKMPAGPVGGQMPSGYGGGSMGMPMGYKNGGIVTKIKTK